MFLVFLLMFAVATAVGYVWSQALDVFGIGILVLVWLGYMQLTRGRRR